MCRVQFENESRRYMLDETMTASQDRGISVDAVKISAQGDAILGLGYHICYKYCQVKPSAM